MNWFKRYAVSCLIVMFILAGIDGYKRPGMDSRFGAIVLVSTVWPVVGAVVVGSTIGEAARELSQSKVG
jgi:hypothetical protein